MSIFMTSSPNYNKIIFSEDLCTRLNKFPLKSPTRMTESPFYSIFTFSNSIILILFYII